MVTLHTPNTTPHERPAWFEIVETDDGLAIVDAGATLAGCGQP